MQGTGFSGTVVSSTPTLATVQLQGMLLADFATIAEIATCDCTNTACINPILFPPSPPQLTVDAASIGFNTALAAAPMPQPAGTILINPYNCSDCMNVTTTVVEPSAFPSSPEGVLPVGVPATTTAPGPSGAPVPSIATPPKIPGPHGAAGGDVNPMNNNIFGDIFHNIQALKNATQG